MRKIGGYMMFFGLFTIVLNYLGRTSKLLAWIYDWGDIAAWAIKIGLIVVGAILFFMGGTKRNTAEVQEEDTK